MLSGPVMQFFLEAKAPESQASEMTMAPWASMIFLMSFMKSESLRRSARSKLRTRPGISVTENCGTRPEA